MDQVGWPAQAVRKSSGLIACSLLHPSNPGRSDGGPLSLLLPVWKLSPGRMVGIFPLCCQTLGIFTKRHAGRRDTILENGVSGTM